MNKKTIVIFDEEYAELTFNRHLWCLNRRLHSLKNIPKKIDGEVYICNVYSLLTSLDFLPLTYEYATRGYYSSCPPQFIT